MNVQPFTDMFFLYVRIYGMVITYMHITVNPSVLIARVSLYYFSYHS